MKYWFWQSVLVLSVFLNVSYACTRIDYNVPIQAEFTRADAVFIGKAVKTEDVKGRDEDSSDWMKIRFRVQQNFKGAETPTFTIMTSDWRGACGLNVKKGETWIVYANYDEDKVFRSIVGKKYDSSENKEEIEILKLASEGKTDTTISGRLGSFMYVPYQYEAAEITVEGNGIQKSTTTGSDGTFSITSLTAGSYRVRMKFPFDAFVTFYSGSDQKIVHSKRSALFEYEVRLNQGDQHHSFFEIGKYSQSQND